MAEPAEIALGVESGKVVMRWHEPAQEIRFDAENARVLAEAIARAAYEAHTGIRPADGPSQITEQIRQRLTTRATHVIRSMMSDHKLPAVIAVAVVDLILREAT